MHVVRFYGKLLEPGRNRSAQVVNLNVVFVHDFFGHAVENLFIPLHPSRRIGGHWRRGRPDQHRAGFLQAGDQGAEIFFVSLRVGYLHAFAGLDVFARLVEIFEIMQAKIKMNHLPAIGSDPLF